MFKEMRDNQENNKKARIEKEITRAGTLSIFPRTL